MTFDAEGRREARRRREEFEILLDASSIGDSAWIECPVHGHTARDPFTDRCVECP